MLVDSIDPTNYNRLISKLIHLTNTRPDISYSVGIVSHYMVSPQQPHLDAIHHILCYLWYTSDYGLLYQREPTPQLQGFTWSTGKWDLTRFTNMDWVACKETRRSIGAYLSLSTGGPIAWSSKRQAIILQSSTEWEYKSLSNWAHKSIHLWLRLLNKLPHKGSTCTLTLLGNISPWQSQKSIHIDSTWHTSSL